MSYCSQRFSSPDLGLHGECLRRGVEPEAGDVDAAVDRLDQEADAMAREARCRMPEVGLEGRVDRRCRDLGRGDAGETVELPAVERTRVVDRQFDALAELDLTAGQAGNAALAALPVARRQVVQHLHQVVLAQQAAQVVAIVGIGKHELDAAKTGPCGARKALREREPR
jgi:hypothetical protein